MNKLIFIPIFSLFLGCAGMGLMTPQMQSKMEEFKEQNIPFMIYGMYIGTNSVGGVTVYIQPRITTPKTIKYIRMTFSAYNEVGDKVVGSIRGSNTFTGEVTGPLNFGDRIDGYIWSWGNAWYNSTIYCIKPISVSVEYMDGTIERFDDEIEGEYPTVTILPVSTLYAPEDLRIKDIGKQRYWVDCNW